MATVKNGKQVLELSHWDASLSQTVEIEKFEEDKKYKLLVRRNEEGTVTIEHSKKDLESMKFKENILFWRKNSGSTQSIRR